MSKPQWRDDEKARWHKVQAGESVVANIHKDKALILWAKQAGLYVYIGRGTPYGNPFKIAQHGDRNAVCERYEKEVLPTVDKAQLHGGKVLGCYCFPLRCHGDSLLLQGQ